MTNIDKMVGRARVRVSPKGKVAPVVNENTVRPRLVINMGNDELLEIPAKIMAAHLGKSYQEMRAFLRGLCTGAYREVNQGGSLETIVGDRDDKHVEVYIGTDG